MNNDLISLLIFDDIRRYEYDLVIRSDTSYFQVSLMNQDKLAPYQGGYMNVHEVKELIKFLQDTLKEFEDKEKECLSSL
jgi:hypothetical protein